MADYYVAVLAKHADEFWATVPDLPGANSAAATEHEALNLIVEFANDYVSDLANDGDDIPPARSLSEIEAGEPGDGEYARVLIPVDVPTKSVKVTLSMDESLLARADRAAKADGLTRSGFISEAINARLRIRTQSNPQVMGVGARMSDVQHLGGEAVGIGDADTDYSIVLTPTDKGYLAVRIGKQLHDPAEAPATQRKKPPVHG